MDATSTQECRIHMWVRGRGRGRSARRTVGQTDIATEKLWRTGRRHRSNEGRADGQVDGEKSPASGVRVRGRTCSSCRHSLRSWSAQSPTDQARLMWKEGFCGGGERGRHRSGCHVTQAVNTDFNFSHYCSIYYHIQAGQDGIFKKVNNIPGELKKI